MTTITKFNFVFPQAARRWSQRVSSLDVDEKIFAILDVYLQPSFSESATIVAQNLAKLYPADPDFLQPGTDGTRKHIFLSRLWELFVVFAEQIPWQHPSQDKIIALLKAIRDLPNPQTINWNDGAYRQANLWTDLPALDAALMDNVETHGILFSGDPDAEKGRHNSDNNFQGFAVRLTVEGLLDISRLAVYRLRDILEEDPKENDVGRYLNTYILPAEVWISLASKFILTLCKSNGENAARNDIPGGKNWKGKEGFSLERWEFWKDRLEEIAGNNKASEETRSIAKRMRAKMITTEAEV